MKMLFVALLLFSTTSTLFSQQSKKPVTPAEEKSIIIGVVTEDPQAFFDVMSLLKNQEGIIVSNHCFSDKLVFIDYNMNLYAGAEDIFDLIESHFPDAKCTVMKNSPVGTKNSCDSEIKKQNIH